MITATELAKELFIIHSHAEHENIINPYQIVYRHEEILALLKKIGLPEPDYEGFSKMVEQQNDYLCEKYLISKPGDSIVETANGLGINETMLAGLMDLTTDRLRDVIDARWPITYKIAIGLENALKVPKEFWLNCQRLFWDRLEEARKTEEQK